MNAAIKGFRINKVAVGILLFLAILSVFNTVHGDTAINVSVNGQTLQMKEPPVIVNGRTLVPLRAIFEALGVTPEWNGETRTVSAKTNQVDMNLRIGDNNATVNGKSVNLEAPGTLVNGSTMVPARFIAETFGATVEWNAETKTVAIKTNETESKAPVETTQGTLTYESGAKYEGSIANGKANGFGTILYEEGSVYTGYFVDDKRNGTGKTTNPDGTVYEGEYKNDMRHGIGTMTFPEGAVYVGEWKEHRRDGKGKLTAPGGYSYEGDWKDNVAYGFGKETLPNGMIFEGEFKKEGELYKGTYTWPDGRILTTSFVNDIPKGMGTYTSADKKVIVGWFTGFGVDAGTQTWPDGTKYSGSFKMDKWEFYREGKGVIVYPDGSSYDGEWKNNLYDGYGTYTNADGTKHIGSWEKGKPLGFAPNFPGEN